MKERNEKMKPKTTTEKTTLHPRNLHRFRYDFEKLTISFPELQKFVFANEHSNETIDFSNPDAVKALNTALLKHHYNVEFWDIPEHYLCPPIPGRADYIHNIADLLKGNHSEIPKGNHIKGLDIGVGASCIYPIIGNYEYDWSFIGSDTNETAIISAKEIEQQNSNLNLPTHFQQHLNSFFLDLELQSSGHDW